MWSCFVSLDLSGSLSFSVLALSPSRLFVYLPPGMGTSGVGEVEVELGSGHAKRLHRAHYEEAATARG